MKISKDKNILISGASIAGLSAAWWLNHIGYRVTVVEQAPAPRTNGAAVDLNDNTIDIAKRMGLYEKFEQYRLGVDRIEYKNADDVTEGSIILNEGQAVPSEEIEIERVKFVKVLLDDMKGQVELIFNNSISTLDETAQGMNVIFKTGETRAFDLVFGCDGSHSATRRIWFGLESDYAHYLGAYFSISIIDKILIPERSMQTYSVPYKTLTLNAYNGKTDIICIFLSEEEISYDYRDIAAQRKMITDQFSGAGWRSTEVLREIDASESFYFDKFTQIRMPEWYKGRVALIGDAAYGPSPASGQGGSLALQGAAAIADALLKFDGDYTLAFIDYDVNLRPLIEEVQRMAEDNVKTHFVLKTEKEIFKRNTEARLF